MAGYHGGFRQTEQVHGIGHLLGLQVHDVAGLAADEAGSRDIPRPDGHPFLRLTRVLEPGFVVTVEPGLYFIDLLLEQARADGRGRHIDWTAVDRLRPCGGIRLEDGDAVCDMVVTDGTGTLLTICENGYGKRTPIVEHTRHGRGTKGMIAIQQTERNGKVVAAALVTKDDEVMLISTGGVLIRTKVKSIREMSRSTQGVTLINLSGGEKLAGLERVVERDEDVE